MHVRLVSLVSIVLGFLALPLLFSPAFACDPATDLNCNSTGAVVTSLGVGASNTFLSLDCLLPEGNASTNALGIVDKCPWLPLDIHIAKVVPTPALPLKPTPTPIPKGDAPESSRIADGNWYNIGPGEKIWHVMDNGNNFYLNVWLDANGSEGIAFGMYAPSQRNGLSVNTQPKGRGAPVRTDKTHDQFWAGSQATGVWYTLVTNYSNAPMQYRIGFQQATEDRNCKSYWEWIGADLVYWTACR